MRLGIDIGTSKVAAVIVDPTEGVTASASRPHHADGNAPPGHAEQDATALLDTAFSVVGELPAGLRANIEAVGVTGQMHGIVILDDTASPLTPLITWRDRRCEDSFLTSLHRLTGHRLRSGFGCATLAWLAKAGTLPTQAASSCTIHDLLVTRLCGSTRPVTDQTGAASWGMYDLAGEKWNSEAAAKAGIDPQLLPRIIPSGATAGHLRALWLRYWDFRRAFP